MIKESQLTKYKFQKTHEITINDGRAQFTPHNNAANFRQPCVYLWLGRKNNSTNNRATYDVLYVGKAKSGPDARMQQHASGFISSVTGKGNNKRIKEYLTDVPAKIFVYTRESEFIDHLDIKSNGYSIEEETFYRLFQPKWNRQAPGSSNLSPKEVLNLKWPDELRDFRADLDSHNKGMLDKLLAWAYVESQKHACEFRLIRGYTNQPEGYSNKPLLVFAQFGPKRKIKKTDLFSIPLFANGQYPLTILISKAICEENKKLWNEPKKNQKTMQPRCLSEFIKNPAGYLKYHRSHGHEY